eukprot:6175525-Pleurochrysis_carterae.AAC.2
MHGRRAEEEAEGECGGGDGVRRRGEQAVEKQWPVTIVVTTFGARKGALATWRSAKICKHA